MLYLVLVLVIGAFALLIAALTTANTLWAWVSVAISVVAAGLLIFDWLRGRRRVATTSTPRSTMAEPAQVSDATTELSRVPGAGDLPAAERSSAQRSPAGSSWPVSSAAEAPDTDSPGPEPEPEPEPEPVQPGATSAVDDAEPGEEPTDAADILVISELSVEVRVVDEHPRYHLAECGWLGDKATIPLPVSEARQLGFTPCARCGPDARLAARHRAEKGARK
ncbi:MAG: hypothetical protein ACJ72N_16485 [Labedaea sp.]